MPNFSDQRGDYTNVILAKTASEFAAF
ncbi:uncharacterized protein METZ01_LOCUS317383 [marine metagenome]|uniref:Uncharacterized protein n=1 Tax=marine metagenome TaxID=408172 RepID=A0A382NTN8_9ZZZZ